MLERELELVRRQSGLRKPASRRPETVNPVTHYLRKPELEVTYEQARKGALFISTVVGYAFFQTVSKSLWAVGALLGYWVGTVLLAETGAEESRDKKGTTREAFIVNGPASEGLLMGGARLAFYYNMYTDLLRETIFLYRTGKLGYAFVKRYQAFEAKYDIEPRRKALQGFASKINRSTLELDKRFGVRDKISKTTASTLEGMSRTILFLRASITDDAELKKKLPSRARDASNRVIRFFKTSVRSVKGALASIPDVALLILGIDPSRYSKTKRTYGAGGANERAFFRNVLLYPPRTPVEIAQSNGAYVRPPKADDLTGAPLIARYVLIGVGWGLGLAVGLSFGAALVGAGSSPSVAPRAIPGQVFAKVWT